MAPVPIELPVWKTKESRFTIEPTKFPADAKPRRDSNQGQRITDKQSQTELKEVEEIYMDKNQVKSNKIGPEDQEIQNAEPHYTNLSRERPPCNSPRNPVDFALAQTLDEQFFALDLKRTLQMMEGRSRWPVEPQKSSGKLGKRGYVCVTKDPKNCFSRLCRMKNEHVLEPLEVEKDLPGVGFETQEQEQEQTLNRIMEILTTFDFSG